MSSQPGPVRQRVFADLALLLVAFVWGATFVVVKDALLDIRPFAFLAVRFAVAAVVLLPFFARDIRRGGWRQAGAGALIGTFLFLGYATQTFGLELTTVGKAGFITGLAVVFVPLFAATLLRQRPSMDSVLGVALATCGLALLTLQGELALNPGDALVLACAAFFALHIIAVGRYCRVTGTSAGALATLQIAMTALLAAVSTAAFEASYWRATATLTGITPKVWGAIAVTALFATSGAFLVQNWAQRNTTPTRTALVFAMEPVFAAATAWVVLAEVLGPRGLAGGCLVLAGMLAAELGPLRRIKEHALSPGLPAPAPGPASGPASAPAPGSDPGA